MCLAVALSVSLSLSHSPLRLLGGVKMEPTGDLCSIMQVCSCAVCCHLFAPHIAFLSVETHKIHSLMYAGRNELWQRLHTGSCARCMAKRCLTSSPTPLGHTGMFEKKGKVPVKSRDPLQAVWALLPPVVCLCFAEMESNCSSESVSVAWHLH